MTFVFTFPGQGSQIVGMGQELAKNFSEAQNVFDEIDHALNEKLSTVMWEGPANQLTLTANAQPALMAVSLAVKAVLDHEYGSRFDFKPAFVAGHSLGEYSALASVGVFTIGDTARLLRLRGQAMQEAVPNGQGGMIALLGADETQAHDLAAAAQAEGGGICSVANDNAPGQIVLSGTAASIDKAISLAPSFNIRRTVPLPVSAPFHCALMQPAADRMAEMLRTIQMNTPSSALVSNVTAQAVSDANTIRTLLVEQVTKVVRWRESLIYMKNQGVDTFFEIGAGRILSGLVKRIGNDIEAKSIGTPGDIASFGEWIEKHSTQNATNE